MKRIINNIWQQFNRNDILPKIASLLLAIIVWAYISSTKIGEIKVRIPINFENLSKALLITEVETGYISLALSGKKEDLKNINKKDFKIIVNLENPIIGKYKKYQVEVIKADIPENIDMSLLKRNVGLTIEKKAYKSVKVIPKISGELNDDFILGSIRVAPEKISLNGPESYIKHVDFVQTNNISIEKVTRDVVKDVPIKKNFSRKIRLDRSNVKIIIKIFQKKSLQKITKSIEIRNTKKEYKYKLNEDYVDIYIKSDDEGLELNENDVKVYIDTASLNIEKLFKNKKKKLIELDFLIKSKIFIEKAKIISISPDSVSLKIMK